MGCSQNPNPWRTPIATDRTTPLAINTVESFGVELASRMSGSDRGAARQCSAYTLRVSPNSLSQDVCAKAGYWPVLGLVVGPGVVLGVGLVVAGVSVPVPPMPLPPMPLPGVPGEYSLSLVPLAPPVGPPIELPVELPLPESEGMLLELPSEVPELPLVPAPESLSFPPPEPPPVIPAHALSNTAQAIGIIHLVIKRSRKDKKAVRSNATHRKTA